MNDVLNLILENDLLSDETKEAVKEGFAKLVSEGVAKAELKIREEFAEKYDADKTQIAEAVGQYVNEHMEKELMEFHVDRKALHSQRLKYVNAQAQLKEQAQHAIVQRLSIFEKAIKKALLKETKELHNDLKVNREAALRTINEVKTQAATDRQMFKVKASKVLENIISVKLHAYLTERHDDIQKAKENDFGARIFEAFIAEARKTFFNSHKELKHMMKRINEQAAQHKQEKAELLQKLSEAQTVARTAINENHKVKDAALRNRKMTELLSHMPKGMAKEKMQTLLESSATADLTNTFKKYAPSILNEGKKKAVVKPLNEGSISYRNGNTKPSSSDDEDDIVELEDLRRRAGIM